MANPISPPFPYKDYLIGEEIILRGLRQQEDHAKTGKYGDSWSENDRIEQGRVFFASSVLRGDFDMTGFEKCMPKPPCPWDKVADNIPDTLFKDIIMGNDGIYSYDFKVFKRTDTDESDYAAGDLLFDYAINMQQLEAIHQPEFSYYQKRGSAGFYKGKALIQIEKYHRGKVEDTFQYLFNFV